MSIFFWVNVINVYCSSDGYNVLTLTFTITESNVLQATCGEQISRKEFDEN